MSVADVEDIYELSPLQQGILFHCLYDGDSESYINQRSFIIEGPLDVDVLLRAWQQAVRAHTALRTSFHWEGLDKPLQVVHRDVPIVIERHDWSGLDDEHEKRLDRLLADDLAAGIDPAVAPLQRLNLIELGERRYGFVWTHHLLLLDGWSVPIFINDVLLRYQSLALGGPLPPPAPPYRDYIAWLQRQDITAARDFWVGTFASGAEATTLAPLLPADPQRGPGPLDARVVNLPGQIEADLRSLAARHRVTLNTVLQAAWALVLQRYSGDAEVTYGVTSAGRPPELSNVDRMLGLFTNTLPVRVSVPDDGELGPWLRYLQATYTDVRRYEYTPLAQIKQWVGAGGSPLFHSLVVVDNYPLAIESGDLSRWLSLRPIRAIEKTSEPLVLTITPEPRFTVGMRFHRDRFPPGAIDEILTCFQAALMAAPACDRVSALAAAMDSPGGGAAHPTATGLVPVAGAVGAAVSYPDAESTLTDLIERQCRRLPDAVAVRTDDEALTYQELWHRAEHTAAALAAAGMGRGSVVGVCAERSLEMVVGLLGAMGAGAAYLPLDPSLPAERLSYMTTHAGAEVVLTQRRFADLARQAGARQVLLLEELPALAPGDRERPPVVATDAAYVMYTSGSTGRPKGVVITHQAIVNRLLWMQETFPLTSQDRVIQKTPFGFDVSVWEFFWPLLTGATMILARANGHQDAEYLAQSLRRHAVTTAHFVPSMLGLFLEEEGASDLPTLRRVLCSGEQLTAALAERFRERLPHVALHNLYGPTEAAVDVTWWDCSHAAPAGVVPIGRPIANTQTYVLDRRLREVPRNVPGELYLGGVQLARGYLNSPGLTAATFVAHPLAGAGGRLYRTGDRVRRLPDGSLEFLGRLDQQVKLLGYRIELGEIEQVLVSHPQVREAAVVVRDRAEGQQLAAYVTAVGDGQPDPTELRDHLRGRLPGFMLPATITVLPAMPLNHNGKLDRSALPDPSAGGPAERARVAPATPREEELAAVFEQVLELPEVDVTASFFELGGSSFDAVRAIRRIDGATVGLLAAHPSVRALAGALLNQEEAGRVLLRLSEPAVATHTLVCVPFGGGSAIGYQPLARTLPPELALLALALPGHELGGEADLRPLEEVAQEAAEAVIKLADGPVSVYGHCAGVAMAVEVVRCLEAAGRQVDRLFLGGAFPFTEPGRLGRAVQRVLGALVSRGLLRVSALTVGMTRSEGPAADQAEMRYLRSIGGFDGVVDDEELAFIMRAFRHDVLTAGRYFSQRWFSRDGSRPLAAPITFIAGTDDPLTSGYERQYRSWERFGSGVELTTVAGGGHYFHQQQPDIVARIIVPRCLAPEPRP